jgi:hypothetical protein
MDADLFALLAAAAESREEARAFAREVGAESPLALRLAVAGSAVLVALRWSAGAVAAVGAALWSASRHAWRIDRAARVRDAGDGDGHVVVLRGAVRAPVGVLHDVLDEGVRR